MDLPAFSRFVEQCATDAAAKFTLDGEQVLHKDLADEHAFLPLIVTAINNIHEQISGTRTSHLSFMRPADPNIFLLGWEVTSLPEVPAAVLMFYANNAIRHYLAAPPTPLLTDPTLPQKPIPGTSSELRDHLLVFGLSRTTPKAEALSTPGY